MSLNVPLKFFGTPLPVPKQARHFFGKMWPKVCANVPTRLPGRPGQPFTPPLPLPKTKRSTSLRKQAASFG